MNSLVKISLNKKKKEILTTASSFANSSETVFEEFQASFATNKKRIDRNLSLKLFVFFILPIPSNRLHSIQVHFLSLCPCVYAACWLALLHEVACWGRSLNCFWRWAANGLRPPKLMFSKKKELEKKATQKESVDASVGLIRAASWATTTASVDNEPWVLHINARIKLQLEASCKNVCYLWCDADFDDENDLKCCHLKINARREAATSRLYEKTTTTTRQLNWNEIIQFGFFIFL